MNPSKGHKTSCHASWQQLLWLKSSFSPLSREALRLFYCMTVNSFLIVALASNLNPHWVSFTDFTVNHHPGKWNPCIIISKCALDPNSVAPSGIKENFPLVLYILWFWTCQKYILLRTLELVLTSALTGSSCDRTERARFRLSGTRILHDVIYTLDWLSI